MRPAWLDFGVPGFFFYIEKRKRNWFFERWREVEGCRANTPDKAIALLNKQLTFRLGKPLATEKAKKA